MPNYNPYEQRRLEGLIPAMRQGLDPMMAYDIFSGVESGALDRMAQNRAARQAAFGSAQESLTNAAAGGLPQGAAMDLLQSQQAMTPALGNAKLGGRLEDMVGNLYQGPGNMSSLYQPEPGTGGGGGAFDQQTLAETLDEAAAAAREAAQRQQAVRMVADPSAMAAAGIMTPPEVTPGPTSLHDLRIQIMSTLRQQGVPEQFLAQVYDLIGTQFQSAGGDPGDAPLSGYGAAAPAGGAPPVPLGGGSFTTPLGSSPTSGITDYLSRFGGIHP